MKKKTHIQNGLSVSIDGKLESAAVVEDKIILIMELN